MSPRHARYEMEYEIIFVFDSDREIVKVAYSYGDVLAKVREVIKNRGLKYIEVRRLESFHIQTILPEA